MADPNSSAQIEGEDEEITPIPVSSLKVTLMIRFSESVDQVFEFSQGASLTIPRKGDEVFPPPINDGSTAETVSDVTHEFEEEGGELRHRIIVSTEEFWEWDEAQILARD